MRRTRLAAAVLSAVALTAPGVPSALAAPASAAPAADSAHAVRLPFVAVVTPVPRTYRAKMIGVSWKPGCPVAIDDLRIVTMTYRGFDGRVHLGRLMVNRDVARSVVRAFRTMYAAGFPIRRMESIEAYGASDDASMAADNTSAFNCRPITGTTDRFSIHSYGRAIDINTVENPYVKGTTVLPPAGRDFVDRTDVRPGMIVKGDVTYDAWTAEGFGWGGDYVSLKDYQHFEFPPS
ncbi:M15 family metallopeptidase [Nocardioides sp. W3-2-3]|uniref:M15 family metallopeptidase n=1 Tax=Nocardioides convexus TaxID=2712224 RepID=UPI0024189342|nr:M15 family metallopeptidase [Nocardioides convexus]NHA01839.1 M15 family metallopeptidase [Nocardioides convexus]